MRPAQADPAEECLRGGAEFFVEAELQGPQADPELRRQLRWGQYRGPALLRVLLGPEHRPARDGGTPPRAGRPCRTLEPVEQPNLEDFSSK